MTVWAIARSPRDLSLSEDEFWDLTPAQFIALLDRQSEALKRELGVEAQIATMLAAFMGQKNLEPSDFLPVPPTQQEAAERLLRKFKALM